MNKKFLTQQKKIINFSKNVGDIKQFLTEKILLFQFFIFAFILLIFEQILLIM
jgi:hypothetical protein